MNGKEIRTLVLQAQERAYFRLALKGKRKQQQKRSRGECLAMADSDPAFLWNLAVADALAGQPLPPFVCNSAALRANCFFLYPDHPDNHIAIVQSLGVDSMKPQRNLLRALLCCRDISLEGIAQVCGLEDDDIRLYSQLRWNFRDRINDGLYVAQLLYPSTRCPGPEVRSLEEADPGLRLCRLGYEKGYRSVLQAAGPALLEESPAQTADHARKFAASILMRGELGFDMGLTSPESNSELGLVQDMKLLVFKDLGQPTDDLSAMSTSMAINESFMRIMRPDAEHRIRLQLGIEEEAANKPDKPAAEPASRAA